MAEAEEDDTYWIDRPDQLRCLISARRSDIVDRLAATGPASIRDLADAIGARPPALYHHIRLLLEVGLIEQAGYRVARRKREQLYRTPSHKMRMSRALQLPENRAVMTDIVRSLTRQMDRDFQDGISSDRSRTGGELRNLGFFRLIGSPDAPTLARVNALLAEIAELLWQARDGDEVVVLNWILAPIGTRGATTLGPRPGSGGD